MSIFSNAYTTEQKVQAVFVGLLGRNAKTGGLDHYVAAIDNPDNNFGIAEMLSELVNSQPEYINAVAGMGRAQLVEYHFLNLFGRQPTYDSEGNNYWVNGAGAAVPADLLVTALIEGASAQDQLALENKVSVAIYMEQNPGLTNDEAKAILAGVGNAPGAVAAGKAAVDDALDPTGDTFVLTAGQDNITGTSKDDTFLANQSTLQTGDILNGNGGDDTLVYSVFGNNSYFFSAPTLNDINTIRVNGPNMFNTGVDIDLSNSDGYNVLESFQTTDYFGSGEDTWVQFLDIQNINGTSMRIIDTNIDHYFSYDSNASLSVGGSDDIANLYLSEVDGSYVEFYTEGGWDSHVDQVNITSATRTGQPNDTTYNYLEDLWFGMHLKTVMIDGDADLEVEDYLDTNVRLVDASELAADLTLDLYLQGLTWVGGVVTNTNGLTVHGAQGDDNLDVGGGEDGHGWYYLGTGNDNLVVGEIGGGYYSGEDYLTWGHQTADLGAGHDYARFNTVGLLDIMGGTGNDTIEVFGHVDNLFTLAAYDGVSQIDSGEGDDVVYVGGFGEDQYSIGDYNINLGAGHDSLVMYVDGDPTITAGAGNDTAVINVLSNVTFFGNEGDDHLTINGHGVHFIDMGEGNDVTIINGGRVGTGNMDNALNDNMTVYIGGEGNDYLRLEGDHFLDANMGEGNDTISLEAKHLTADDFIRGDEDGASNVDTDTIILTNEDGKMVVVGDSETNATTGFEIYDLRNQNIELHLTQEIFNTARDNHITVTTRNANGVELPVLTIGGVLAVEFTQGMSRAQYNVISANFDLGVYDQSVIYSSLEEFLLDNGVNIIDFTDASDPLNGDQQFYDDSNLPGDPLSSIDPVNDEVFFLVEPPGQMVIDITDVALSTASGRTFTLLGGNIKDVVIADDDSINGRLILNFDDPSANNSIEDTLIVDGAATITAADLRNVTGMEKIILRSDANTAQTWNIGLTDRVINQTTGTAPLIIEVDAEVPAGSVLNIELDPTVASALNDVYIDAVSNITVFINGVQVTEPDFGVTDYNTGPALIQVFNRLLFTTNTDSLVGSDFRDDLFVANSLSQVQNGDSADGKGGEDTLQLNFAVSNPNASLWNQLNQVSLTSIEHIVFNTGINVQMNEFDARQSAPSPNMQMFPDVVSMTTGLGNDTLTEMRALGNMIGQGYFLNVGDDFISLSGEDDTFYVDGGLGEDMIIGLDEGQTIYANDVELIGLDDYGDVYVSQSLELPNNKDIYVWDENSSINGQTATIRLPINGTLYTSNIESVYGSGGNDTIDAWHFDDLYVAGGNGHDDIFAEAGEDAFVYGGNGNDTLVVYAGEDAYVEGGQGDDSIWVSAAVDAYVEGGPGNDTITVYAGEDAYVEGGPGDDDIYVHAGDDVTVDGGPGNDSIEVKFGDGVGGGVDTAMVSGGSGDDTITVNTIGNDLATIEGGSGDDIINLLVSATGGMDRVVFGNITYDALQVKTDGNGFDIINGFNFELGGAGVEDQLDFNVFLNLYTGPAGAAIQYGDWTGTGTAGNATNVDLYNVAVPNAQRPFAVIAADANFVLNASHIVQGIAGDSSQLGIEIQDNNRAVVIVAKDTDGVLGFDTFDVYFVQDVDQDGGSAWAVDHVATINSATQIGAITSIDIENLPAYNWA